LLDGVDGDTTVSHGFERLPELAKQLRFGRLVKEARAVSRRAPSQSWTTWRVLKTYALSPLLPRRRAAVGFQDLLSDDFAKRWDIPGRIRRQENAAPRFRDARSVHLDSFQSPIIPHVLELADKAAAAYGLEPRYPFFDRRLMEFCLALPAEQKLSDGWSRLILRRAMHGVLPPELQWRNSKANLSPNFNRAMRESAVATLERVIATNRSPAIGRILDFGALAKLQARYAHQPSDRDAMTLFTALTLITWMSTNGRP